MDEVPATVFQPSDGDGEYAIIVDQSYDACVLRDVLKQAAMDRSRKIAKATQGSALKRNQEEFEILNKYAGRFERIRIEVANDIGLKLKRSTSQG